MKGACWRSARRANGNTRPSLGTILDAVRTASSPRLANTAPVGAVEERAPSLVATLSLAAAGYLEEGLPAGDVALGVHALLAALLRLVQRLARLAEARLEVGAVERVRVHRLLDQHQRAVVHHLEVALALREPDDVRLGLVEAQLGGLQDRHQRRVVGQDADRPHARARGDHLDLVVEDLPLRGQDLGLELRSCHLLARLVLRFLAVVAALAAVALLLVLVARVVAVAV